MSDEGEGGVKNILQRRLYRDGCAAAVPVFVKFPMKAMIAFVSLL